MNHNSGKSLDLLNNLLYNSPTLSLCMLKPFISEIKFTFRTKSLYWTSALPAVIFETYLLSTINSIKVLNHLQMMASERAEICIGDYDIAIVNFYFKEERSRNFSKMVFRNNSHCNRNSSL